MIFKRQYHFGKMEKFRCLYINRDPLKTAIVDHVGWLV